MKIIWQQRKSSKSKISGISDLHVFVFSFDIKSMKLLSEVAVHQLNDWFLENLPPCDDYSVDHWTISIDEVTRRNYVIENGSLQCRTVVLDVELEQRYTVTLLCGDNAATLFKLKWQDLVY